MDRSTMTARGALLLEDFAPRRLPSTLAAGLTMALMNALVTVALMTLIFSDSLAQALPIGIGVGLVASAASGLIIPIMSGFAGMYAGVQDTSAAVLALAAGAIAASLVGPEATDTVVAMMAATSLATGVMLFVMGSLRLGQIARFVPFPVIGGLLAGTGYLILDGSLDILGADGSADNMLQNNARGLLWPGLVFGGLFVAASMRKWAPKAYLGLLVAGIAGFHFISRAAGVTKQESLDRGWLLGPFPDGGLWPGFVTGAFSGADWSAIGGEAVSLITVLLLVPLTLLLYISALEVGTNTDIDSNAELRSSGLANLVAGAFGGPPGFLYLSDTLITHNLLGGRRGPPIISALGMLSIVLVGGSVLEFVPQFVIGGLLLFVGINFMVQWLWTSRRRMTRLDYALMVGIVVIIATAGFLAGVATGLAAAVALFIYRYSRIDVVRHLLTVREHRSNIERPPDQARYLSEVGSASVVMELQGFIFFGTANQIVHRIREHLEGAVSLRHVVFDFRLVSGVDSSAVALFGRIGLLGRENGFNIVLSGLKPAAQEQFSSFISDYSDVVAHESDLDHGMQWCEDRLLEDLAWSHEGGRAFPEGLMQALGPYIESLIIPQGDALMRKGDPTPGMFLITSGRATVLLEEVGAGEGRLRTLHEGTVLGEIGLYLREPCTATVIADASCEVMHLTPEAFDDVCRRDPAAAAELHVFVAHSLAGRLSHANSTIRALQA